MLLRQFTTELNADPDMWMQTFKSLADVISGWNCPSSLRDCLALAEEAALREEDEVAAPLGDEDLRQVALQRHQRLITVLLTLLEETARCFDE